MEDISYEIRKKRNSRPVATRMRMGFGLAQIIWITPHPILSTLKSLTSKKKRKIYSSFRQSMFGDREILIEKVQNSFDKSYRELFQKWYEILSSEDEKAEN